MDRGAVGVVEESVLEFELAVPTLVLLEERAVVLPVALAVLFVRVLIGEEELRPAFDEGLSVLTAPFEAEDVRPEVLCAVEPELELLEPWM